MLNTEQHTCVSCRFYLPSEKTFYNKPTGYCANSRIGKPRRGLSPMCKLFELDPKAPKPKPP